MRNPERFMSDTSFESRAGAKVRRIACSAGLLFVLLTAGCGGFKPAPPGPPPQSAAPQAETTTVAPVVPPAAPSIPPPPATATPQATAVAGPTERPATSSPAPSPTDSATKAAPPAAKAPPKVLATPAPAAQPPKKETVATDTATPKAAPPLDLTSLETQLKETKAIGLMTKITLKNQVDDLLNQFRAFYAGKLKTTLAELRRPYDLLVLKVLSLLQDSDPALASAIVASREAIWGILSDPVKFATI
jgi:hypothetical protein